MSILQEWQDQREVLRTSLTNRMTASEVVYQARHALMQTQQNALAGMEDPVLRQQAGILMNSLMGSLGFLEAHTAGKAWVAQKSTSIHSSQRKLWRVALAILAVCTALCIFRDEWFAAVLSLAGTAVGLIALVSERKNGQNVLAQDDLRITVGVDVERMLAVLDGQLRAADRFLDDFAYLNEQAQAGGGSADPAVISRAVDLMEALYDCSDEKCAPIEDAARHLLLRLGLETIDYTEDTSRFFNALPSKSVTRTLSPAIVSVKEQKLLRRGTAAVRIDAA